MGMDLEVVGEKGVSWAPSDFKQAVEFSAMIAKTSFAPKDYRNKPEECLMAMMAGNEVGLGAMASLQNIAVINGRPSIFGDAGLALVKASPDYEYMKEEISSDGKSATCTAKRRGEDPVNRTFNVEDATRAGLWGKQGPWTTYPKRMLQMRARAWAIRDTWPHVLKGLAIKEESDDIPSDLGNREERVVTTDHVEEKIEDVKNPFDVQKDRLIEILENAVDTGKATQEDSDQTKENSKKYTTAPVLEKWIDKVEAKISNIEEGEM